jgi:tRNA-Thr(GGU) m(6)t(6)A37 methyltransferase TsaA
MLDQAYYVAFSVEGQDIGLHRETTKVIPTREEYSLHPIGHIRSTLRPLADAPRQGSEGAPDAWLEANPAFERALLGIAVGDEVIVVTWLHRADRAVLETHPRNDPEIPLTGVFATRSPDRPNPLGLHRVTVREISGTRLRIGPIEAIDGTPVVDVKPVRVDCADA